MTACEQSRVNAEARGYLGELEWLEKMNRRYTQHKCPKCQLFHIFKQKTSTPAPQDGSETLTPEPPK